MDTDTLTVIIVIAVVLLVIVLAVLIAARRRRTAALRSRFGPEYDQTVDAAGSPRKAETELLAREKRVATFEIRPLSADARERYRTDWQAIQARFVDDPTEAANDAHELVTEVMRARGYPVSDFDQQAADLSVEHPVVVQHYRGAHDIALRHRDGTATTEDLRQAMVHLRALFDELVTKGDVGSPVEQRSVDTARPFG